MNLFGFTVTLQQVFFLSFASVAVLCSLLMITRRNAIHSALLLVIAFFQLGGIYILLRAEFIAALQVLVYAGAILVLFVFVIMLLQLREAPRLQGLHKVQKYLAGPLGVALAVELVLVIWFGGVQFTGLLHQAPGAATNAEIAATGGSPRALGQLLYTVFLLPFEIASLILLVAVIGAIVLARREEPAEVEQLIPTPGISLGMRSLAGSPQAEQLAKVGGLDVEAAASPAVDVAGASGRAVER
jgi:NADH-quinone oxidoreductase subunit J